jgi:2-keto-4-pentenoate hydratase
LTCGGLDTSIASQTGGHTAGAQMQTPGDLAASLWGQHRERTPFQSIKKLLPEGPSPIDSAYAVQAELVQLMVPSLGIPTGYKIGLTSLRMQQMCGLNEPVAGRLLEGRIQRGGARVQWDNYVRLGVESELCVVLKEALPLRLSPYTISQVGDAIGAVAAAFELIDDRGADYAQLDALSLVADNSWNAGVVLGELASPMELGAIEGTLQVNGQLVDTGNSRDALSHPLAAVLWLSDHLHRHGSYLRAGDLVMTGSIVPTRTAKVGEHYRFELAGLPPAELWVI